MNLKAKPEQVLVPWLDLHRDSEAFAQRIVTLTAATVAGNGARAYRLQEDCARAGEQIWKIAVGGHSWQTLGKKDLGRLPPYSDTWAKEQRNVAQIASLTYDELAVWMRKLWDDWAQVLVVLARHGQRSSSAT